MNPFVLVKMLMDTVQAEVCQKGTLAIDYV